MKHLKEEFDKLTFKEVVIYSLAFVSIVAGFTLLFLGMYIPPSGQIHESVLTAFGLTLVFVGALVGVSLHFDALTKSFKSEILKFLNDRNITPPDNNTPT